MHRFYLPADPSAEESGGPGKDGMVILPSGAARQVARVLRMRPGERIAVFDGSGAEWEVVLETVAARRVSGRVVAVSWPDVESSVDITLCPAIIDHARFELVLQKGTELGASGFVPVISERVRGAGPTGASARRLARWRRILEEAAEQSGRTRVPSLTPPVLLEDACEAPSGPVLLLWEDEASLGLREALRGTLTAEESCLRLVVGPKGGFTADEVRAARARGAVAVSLGVRVLRAETAAIAALSAALYELGELGG